MRVNIPLIDERKLKQSIVFPFSEVSDFRFDNFLNKKVLIYQMNEKMNTFPTPTRNMASLIAIIALFLFNELLVSITYFFTAITFHRIDTENDSVFEMTGLLVLLVSLDFRCIDNFMRHSEIVFLLLDFAFTGLARLYFGRMRRYFA